MILIFDTVALSLLLNEDKKVIEIVSDLSYDKFIAPLAVDAELRFGYKNGNREAANLLKYDNLRRAYGLEIIEPDAETSLIYAELATWCRQNGIPVSNNDLWIGSASVQHGAKLLTFDKGFNYLPQIRLAI